MKKEKYRRRMTSIADNVEQTIVQYSLSDDVTDEQLERAQRDQGMMGDVDTTLEKMYASLEKGLAEIEGGINNKILRNINGGAFVDVADNKITYE